MEDKVNIILVEMLGVRPEQIKPEATIIEDLGADSLDLVETCMAIEEEFCVEIQDEIAEEWKTVKDIYDYFTDTIKEK